jgi:hypothetical protein
MAARRFELETELPVSANEAYSWHLRRGALERLTPPWERVRVLERQGDLSGGTVTLEVPIGPIRQRWVARHRDAVPGRRFVDEQIEGPFASWVHAHLFEPLGTGRCRYIDRIDYEMPFAAMGKLGAGVVRAKLERVFRYRHTTLRQDLAAHHRYEGRGPQTVLVTGATGLIAQSLIPFLTTGGHRVRRLVRRAEGPDDVVWDAAAGRLDGSALEGTDAVVHLAGEPIAADRWTPEKRRRILESRTAGTTLLADTLAGLACPPRVLISASAIGIYGDRGAEALTEDTHLRTGPGTFFVEQVGHAWEAGTAPAERAGIRVVRLRIGIVLTPAGGALAQMLPPFMAGVGGRLGNGRQYMSWIGIDDVVGAIHHAIMTDSVRGPVNATGPDPVTNAEFTKALGAVLGRPALFAVPATALRLLFGELADELLLSSLRVLPERLQASGYPFRFPTLVEALRHVLGR